jgi:hypothetical protein
VVADLRFDDIVGTELVDLRHPESRGHGRVPLIDRPLSWLVSLALEVKYLCLGIRLAAPEGWDRMGPRWASQRAHVRGKYGVDVLVPVSNRPEEAQVVLDVFRSRFQAFCCGKVQERRG